MQRCRKYLCAAKNAVNISLPGCKRATCEIAGEIKRKTEEESPSLAVAGSWAARKKSKAESPSLALAGSWTADHSPNREW